MKRLRHALDSGFVKDARLACIEAVRAALAHSLQTRPGPVRSTQAGFTLVEMLVSISIIGLISTVIMMQYTRFDSQLLLRNMAYELALGVRQAQSLGISVTGGGAGGFTAPYGVHFTVGTNYVLFRDINSNFIYDSGEGLTTMTIERGNRVADLCIAATCSKTSLDIVFVRPDPDAHFAANGSAVAASSATVVLKSKDNTYTRTVVVSTTGQVSVQ